MKDEPPKQQQEDADMQDEQVGVKSAPAKSEEQPQEQNLDELLDNAEKA